MIHGNSKYPLELKLAVCCGEELKYYDREEIRRIPKATLAEWRKTPLAKFVNQFESGVAHPTVEKYLTKRSEESSLKDKAMMSYLSFVDLMKESMGEKAFVGLLQENKEKFIDLVENLEGLVTQQEFLEHAGITRSRYWDWRNMSIMECTITPDKVCARRRPMKITEVERLLIRSLVKEGGPNKYAIWATALRDGVISVGKQTFYNHTRDLMTAKQRRQYRREPTPIRAENVHDIWHADISYFQTLYGQTWYLYCIVDNKSRGIVNWRLKDKLSKEISSKVMEEAYLKYSPGKIIYMTDGGSENKKIMDTHLMDLSTKVTHWVAGKSILASNSMIERVFHTLKNEFGSVHVAQDGAQLREIVRSTIEAYMNRPHSRLGIYTPQEVMDGKTNWFDAKAVLKTAKMRRMQRTTEARCKNCKCSVENRC